MHAACLELVHDRVTENARVLDVGSGSGYLTSCFAAMLDQHDSYAAGSIRAEEVEDRRPGLSDTKYPIVVGVEHIEDLVDFSIKNVKKDGKVKYLEGLEPNLLRAIDSSAHANLVNLLFCSCSPTCVQ